MIRNWTRMPGFAALLVIAALLPHPSFAADRPVTLGLDRSPTNALAFVADDRGFFPPGTVVRYFPSGKLALESMLAGEIDIALSTDTPIALACIDQPDLRVIATIGSSTDEHRIVARRDKGIVVPKDLKGKRVGTQKGSAVHYFLDMFLAKHGLDEKNVRAVFMSPDALVPALARGDVDAISMREPYTQMAIEALKGNAVLFEAPGIHRKTYHVVTTGRFLGERRKTAVDVLSALVRSEEFLRREPPDRAIRLIASKAGIPVEVLARQWEKQPVFEIYLDQSLLRALENQVRWAVRSHIVEPKAVPPDFMKCIDFGVMDSLDRSRVTIVR